MWFSDIYTSVAFVPRVGEHINIGRVYGIVERVTHDLDDVNPVNIKLTEE